MEANASAGADSIILPAATMSLTQLGYEDEAVDGDLDVLDDLYLQGQGRDLTIIDGNGAAVHGRVFQIGPGVKAFFSGFSIQDGYGPTGTAEQAGTGIYSEGELHLAGMRVSNNEGYDGAVFNANPGTLEIDSSLIQSNVFLRFGGIVTNGPITITRSTISDNDAVIGGGIYQFGGSMTIKDSTINGNFASSTGGGIHSDGSSQLIVNSTISGNSTNYRGGGIWVKHSAPSGLFMYNVTVAFNYSDANDNGSGVAGGINQDFLSTGSISMANSIVGNNFLFNLIGGGTPSDCEGTLSSLGYNLIETVDAVCAVNGILTGNKTGMDPALNSLANFGGPTNTHALYGYSPAIDAGNPSGCRDEVGALLPFDQREHLRHVDGYSGVMRCDMGSYEFQAPPAFRNFLPALFR
jgi:hypothetical protein